MFSCREKRRPRFPVLLVFLGLPLAHSGVAEAGEEPRDVQDTATPEYMSSDPTGEEVPWQVYIEMAGDKLGCYFTIEVLYNSDDASLALATRRMVDNQKVSSIDELIAKVSKDVEGIALVRNRKNRSIIHVIDERLRKIDRYALEEALTIAFSGVLGDLARVELPKRLTTIGPRSGGLSGDAVDDHVTKVTVNAKDQKVRDILTDSVPLDIYRSILWRAETSSTRAKTETSVRYYGPDAPRPGYHPGRLSRAISWQDYAVAMAEKLDCYLTIERLPFFADGAMRWSPFAKYVRRSHNVETVEELIETLRHELEDVRVMREGENPVVIHLVEGPLSNIEGYFMERRVDLDYSGSLGGMVVALAKKYPDLGFTANYEKAVGDNITRVQVALRSESVRSLLTKSVPLKGYQRILWESETAKKDEDYLSWVRYFGRKPSSEEPDAAPANERSIERQEDLLQRGGSPVAVPPLAVCATTAAGCNLVRDLSDHFARSRDAGTIAPDLTMRWFPFGEFIAGRFAGVLHTTAAASERRVAESSLRAPLREVLLGEIRLIGVVHRNNPIESVCSSRIGLLLRDNEATWRIVGGDDRKATCYVESEKSASRELLQWMCMTWRTDTGGGRYPYRKDVLTCTSAADVIEKVATDTSGFGLFLYNPNDEKVGRLFKRVKVLKVGKTEEGPFVEPRREPILQDEYPFSEPIILFLHPRAPLLMSQFSDYCTSAAGAKIAERHGVITRWRQQQYQGDCRLEQYKAGKGTPVVVCGLAGREEFVKALAVEYVKAKAVVQVKYEARATAEEAEAAFREAGEVLVAEGGGRRTEGGGERAEGGNTTYLLGHRAVGVIVHRDNAARELTLDDLRGIYSGQIDAWPGASGKDAKIRLYSLGPETAAMKVLGEVVSGKGEGGGERAEGGRHARITRRDDTAKVVQAVGNELGALGFVDLAAMPAKEASVRLLAIVRDSEEGRVRETHRTSGQGPDGALHAPYNLPEDYPLARPVTLCVHPRASETAKDFAAFIAARGPEVQEALKANGIVPAPPPKESGGQRVEGRGQKEEGLGPIALGQWEEAEDGGHKPDAPALTPDPSPKGRGEQRALTPDPSPKGRGEQEAPATGESPSDKPGEPADARLVAGAVLVAAAAALGLLTLYLARR